VGEVVAVLSLEGDAFQLQQAPSLVQTLGKSIPGAHHALCGKEERAGRLSSRDQDAKMRGDG